MALPLPYPRYARPASLLVSQSDFKQGARHQAVPKDQIRVLAIAAGGLPTRLSNRLVRCALRSGGPAPAPSIAIALGP